MSGKINIIIEVIMELFILLCIYSLAGYVSATITTSASVESNQCNECLRLCQ